MGIAMLLVGIVVVVGLDLWRRDRAALGPADREVVRALGVPDTPATRELLGRWRDRARRWRTVAALPTVAFAGVASVHHTGAVRLGLVDTVATAPLWADPLVAGLLAVAIGGFAAELHHLRRTATGPRTAELRPREVAPLRRRWSRRRRTVLLVLVGVAFLAHLVFVLPGRAAGSFGALLLATSVLLLAEAVERRIAARPRPALTTDLAAADDVVRRAAVRSVDDSASGAVLLLTGWASLGTVDLLPAGVLTGLLAVAGALAVLALSLWWAWRSAPHRLLAGGARREVVTSG